MGRAVCDFTGFFIGHPSVRLFVIGVKGDVLAAEYHVYFLSNVCTCNQAFPARMMEMNLSNEESAELIRISQSESKVHF